MALSLCSSSLGFAGSISLPNPLQPVIARIAEVSVVGLDQRRYASAVTQPLRSARAAVDRLATSIVMQDSWPAAVSEEVEVPPVFAPVGEEVPLPPPEDFDPEAFAQSLPGISAPLGFFDPAGFCARTNGADGAATEGKIRFYREVELKHGRIAMLAALGFPLAELPVFGQVPSYVAFQASNLQTFWPALVLAIAIIEVFSIIPAFENPNVEGWAIKSDHVAGDYGFDPMGLKPTDAAELEVMQTKELNNGRLAMVGIAGMVAQELVTGSKLF